MTNEEQAAYLKALLAERRMCERTGQADRVIAIDEQLRGIGYNAEKPAARATRRPIQRRITRR